MSVAQIKGSLTLRSCNTSFQTELIYRLRERFQKARILFPLGRRGGGGGGPFIRELCRVIKKRGGCNYVYPPPGPVCPPRGFGRRLRRSAKVSPPPWHGLCLAESGQGWLLTPCSGGPGGGFSPGARGWHLRPDGGGVFSIPPSLCETQRH